VRNILILTSLLALCSTAPLAQTGSMSRSEHSATLVSSLQPSEVPAALVKIFDNLGPKADAYDDQNGWGVSGPNSLVGAKFFALPFTPKSSSHVSEVRAALQYGGSGANQVDLSIYEDSEGVPGTLLAGPVTVANLPAEGTCCTLAVADFTPVAVTGGNLYWVVADTPTSGTGSDFFGAWYWMARPVYVVGSSIGSGWSSFDSTPDVPAAEVLGTVP
jgi:hypothetical protein